MKHFFLIMTTVYFLTAYQLGVSKQNETKQIAGWVERVILFPDQINLKAKLDTGAKTSSIHATDIKHFKKNNQQWARFKITNYKKRTIVIEKPIIRTTTIKRHFGRSQKRPVIKLDICVGRVKKTVNVNLVDRTGFNYQLLIGRNFLSSTTLIDSGQSFILSPDCSQ